MKSARRKKMEIAIADLLQRLDPAIREVEFTFDGPLLRRVDIVARAVDNDGSAGGIRLRDREITRCIKFANRRLPASIMVSTGVKERGWREA